MVSEIRVVMGKMVDGWTPVDIVFRGENGRRYILHGEVSQELIDDQDGYQRYIQDSAERFYRKQVEKEQR